MIEMYMYKVAIVIIAPHPHYYIHVLYQEPIKERSIRLYILRV